MASLGALSVEVGVAAVACGEAADMVERAAEVTAGTVMPAQGTAAEKVLPAAAPERKRCR